MLLIDQKIFRRANKGIKNSPFNLFLFESLLEFSLSAEDVFLNKSIGYVDNKFLAAGIVAYRRAREANLLAYPNVNRTLVSLTKLGIKLAVVSDAPSREAWMRIYYLNLYHFF